MIEQILRKKPRTFQYGEVDAVSVADNRVHVKYGKGSAWVNTAISLEIGSVVIMAKNEDSTWFIVQDSRKALPSQGVLLLV